MRSVGKISSASLSVSDTGTPEFVSRIYIPWLAWVGRGESTDVPSRPRPAYSVSLASPRGAGSPIMPSLARR